MFSGAHSQMLEHNGFTAGAAICFLSNVQACEPGGVECEVYLTGSQPWLR